MTLAYGTIVTIKPDCKRHDIKTAMIILGNPTNGGGVRYEAIFICNSDNPTDGKLMKHRVYQSEIGEQVTILDMKEANAIMRASQSR